MPTDEQELIRQSIAGDRVATERLLAMYGLRLAGYLQPRLPHFLAGVVDVEDILQQTFLQAYRDVARFDYRGPDSFFFWLREIADNRLMDCVRRHRRTKRGGKFRRMQNVNSQTGSLDVLSAIVAPVGTPSQSFSRREAEEILRVAMGTLLDDQREAIQRHCLEGESLKIAAKEMGKTQGAIRALVHRGKAKLRQRIACADIW